MRLKGRRVYRRLNRVAVLAFNNFSKGSGSNIAAGSHRIYKTPWQADPRINIQNHKGKAKAYQVKQVILALEKLEVDHGAKK